MANLAGMSLMTKGLITTVEVKTRLLGNRLAAQLLYRMEHSEAPYEVIYVRPPVIYRDSILR